MSAVALRTHIQLGSIEIKYSGGLVPSFQAYLWSVFFKIDGQTVQVISSNSSLNLQGTATVVGTTGDHDDLPGQNYGETYVPIPSAIGDYVSILAPIPVPALNAMTGGVLGYVGVLFSQQSTPANAVAQGHQALNESLQQALNSLIPSLGTNKTQPTAADLTAIENQVSTAVTSAITNGVSVWDVVLTVAGLENQDSLLGNVFTSFSESQLAASPAGGIPIQKSFDATIYVPACTAGEQPVQPSNPSGPTGPAIPLPASSGGSEQVVTFTFYGKVVADPLPLALKRIVTGAGFDPSKGLLAAIRTTYPVLGLPGSPPGRTAPSGWDAINHSVLAWVDFIR